MSICLRRRAFIAALGGAAGWPVVARAQRAALPVIGFLCSETAASFAPYVAAFQRGLNELGYVEGKNVAVEYRWAEGQYDRLPALAADLVNRRVAVIVSNITGSRAAKAATTSIPIVFSTGDDPVEAGLVASLNRPGDRVTGATSMNAEVAPKLIELLHEIMPTATTFAALINPIGPLPASDTRVLETAARNLGLQVHILQASTERDIDTVFASLGQLRAGGLVVHSNAFFINRNEQLAELALR
jgi:putative ABC transport system substrate-binding protein